METPNTNQNHTPSLPREKWCGNEFLYQFLGFWFPIAYLRATQKLLENFKPLPTDIILASFPKTGTTWLKTLLYFITHRSLTEEISSNHPHDLIPSLETKLYLQNDHFDDGEITMNPPRILGTHLPYQIFGHVLNSSECKVVYVTRNPKDTLISLWHFIHKGEILKEGDDPWELETAVEQFCEGILPFGCYYDHVLGYREESLRRPEKVFFVTYEELKEDTKKWVKKMGEFLEYPFDEDENGEKEMDEIVKKCSFDILSNYEVNKSSELPNGFPMPFNSFFRKGVVGDYVNYLDDEMIKKIDAVSKEKFTGSDFLYGI